MNQRVAIILFLVLTSASSAFAQSIEDKKKIDIQSKSSVKAGELLLSTEQIKPELPKSDLPDNSSYFVSAYPIVMKSNPTIANLYKFQQKQLFKQFAVAGSSAIVSYTGLGESIILNGAIRWMPSKKLSIDAGGMFSRQFYFASPLFRQDMMGINTRMQYTLTNNIRLNVWGQYIFQGEALPFSAYNSLFPHTGVGASVSVDLKKDAEMSVGAEYQYDNKSQKWRLESSGRVSIGF